MPELPEVETTRRGIEPHILGRRIEMLKIREGRLRWPVPDTLVERLPGQQVQAVTRRAKYLLLQLDEGTLLLHLGMSGSLRIVATDRRPERHDHIDLVFGSHCLRFRDPRRFGALLWTEVSPELHPLLAQLGPEPLTDDFNGSYLHRLAGSRRTPVKNFIMDGKVVVGVGNIYANESLFLSGIHPHRPCGRVSLMRYRNLAAMIKQVLTLAIGQGGTTLRDFVNGDGKPGYFAQRLQVYGRPGEACPRCGSPIQQRTIGQRSSFYCGRCQR